MSDIPREIIQRLTALKLGNKLNDVLSIMNDLLRPRSKDRGICLPSDWKPSQGDLEYGLELGLSCGEIRTCAEDMRLWAEANRNRPVAKKADWGRAFKGWMRREAAKKKPVRDEGMSYMQLAQGLRDSNGHGDSAPDFFEDTASGPYDQRHH